MTVVGRVAAIVLVGIWVTACGSAPTPTTNQPISLVHVSDAGPVVRTAALLASPSLADLEALIAGSDHPGVRPVSDCLTESGTPKCWSQPPENSLLLAVENPPPALWGKCAQTQIVDEDLTGNTMSIHVRVSRAACTGVTASRAHYSLYAIGLSELPNALVTILLADSGDGIDPDSKAHFPWQFETVVDLRSPLPGTIPTTTRTQETQAAVLAAWQAIAPTGWDVSEVATRRWNSSLNCSDTPSPTQLDGYLIAIYYTVNVKYPPGWTTREAEFHIASGRVIRCDR